MSSLQNALELHLSGQLLLAENAYRELEREDARDPNVLFFLGIVRAQRGDPNSGYGYVKQALELVPDDALFCYSMADICKTLDRVDESELWLRRTLSLVPKHAEALQALGSILHDRGAIFEALKCFRHVLEIQPNDAPAHNNVGVMLLHLRQYEDARILFQQAIAIQNNYAEAINNLGIAHKNLRDIDEAIAKFEQALSLKPDYPMAMLNLGSSMLIKKDYERALEWTQALLEVSPDLVEAHQNAAAIYLELGQLDRAKYHRDQAYSRQSIFVDFSPTPARTILIPWAAGKGNIPLDYLLPKERNQCVTWVMEYANEEQISKLPHYDAVFNAIGDDDALEPALDGMKRLLLQRGIPVLNHPDAVQHTARDSLPSLLAGIPNVVVPTTIRVGASEIHAATRQFSTLRFPLLLRPSGSHGGDHLERIDSAEELNSVRPWSAEHYYLSNFHDFCSPDGFYRKYRMIFVDRKPMPYHLAISTHWLVHYETAGMLDSPLKLAEEAAFLAEPHKVLGNAAMSALHAIGQVLNLDYCGIDFSMLPDRRLLVFEANATMLVHPEDANGQLGHKNVYVQRIIDDFDAVLGAYRHHLN